MCGVRWIDGGVPGVLRIKLSPRLLLFACNGPAAMPRGHVWKRGWRNFFVRMCTVHCSGGIVLPCGVDCCFRKKLPVRFHLRGWRFRAGFVRLQLRPLLCNWFRTSGQRYDR
jgi:hypothetical protein